MSIEQVTLRLSLAAGTLESAKTMMGDYKFAKPLETVVLERTFTKYKKFNGTLTLGSSFPQVAIDVRRSTDATNLLPVLRGGYTFAYEENKNDEVGVDVGKAMDDLKKAVRELVTAGWTVVNPGGAALEGDLTPSPAPEPVPTQ